MTAHFTRSSWIRAIVTIAILAYLARRIDMGAAASALVGLNLASAALVLILIAVDRGVMIVRWLLLLRASRTAIATKSAVWIYLVSSFVGSFLPAGVGGDAVRAYTLGQRTADTSEAIASVAVDRVMGMLSIALVGIAGIIAWAGRFDPGLRQLGVVMAGFAVAATAGLFWADRLLRTALPDDWHDSRHGRRLLRLADALARYRDRRGTILLVLGLSIGVQALRVLEAYVLGRGLGIDVAFAYYLVFMPVGLLVLLLPISVSGFGLPQGVIVWLLAPQGVAEADAFALSTLIVLSGLVGNLPGALLYVRARKT